MSAIKNRNLKYVPACLVLLIFLMFSSSYALDPEEVLVVTNLNAAKSKELAEYYMEKRHIPEENIVSLFITDKEICSRNEYEKKAIPPIREFLRKNNQIRAIVTMYGVPLKISSPEKNQSEKAILHELETKKTDLEDLLTNGKITGSDARLQKHNELSLVNKNISDFLKKIDKVASFDSEVALVKKDRYDLNMWIANPYYLGFRNQKPQIKKSDVLMVSRLDGANGAIVKRIINDSIEAEKIGLKGSAYFDARWKDPGTKKMSGYAFYDQSIHRISKLLSEKNRIRVTINDDNTLFKKGESPDTALYCGWYSLGRYVDAFAWQKGSVGYHIASSECATLKRKNSKVWCKRMLDKGIAATIGPVGEPYVQSFPVPEIFFNHLTEGYLTLVESYLISLPYLSWKMVLVGDPLYKLNLKQ